MISIFVCPKCSGKLEKIKGNMLKCVLCNNISDKFTCKKVIVNAEKK